MDRSWIPEPPHRGGCLCGAVRYAFDARPLSVVACHCRDCQKFSGATNLLTVFAPRESFTYNGEVDRYRKRGESGNEVDYFRCAKCGVRLWHEPLTGTQVTMVAAGTLDEPGWALPVAHIWTSRAAPSAVIPEGVPAWEKGPPDRAQLIAIFQKMYPA